MDRAQCRSFRLAAEKSLQSASYDPKKLILIHSGAAALVSLVISALAFALQQQVSGAVGLGGLGTRGILMTAQMVLQLLPPLLMPFWTMGYLYATVTIAQDKPAQPAALGEGFFRFGPVLRLELLLAGMYTLLMFAATQLGSTVFLWTPWAQPFMDSVLAFVADPQNAAVEQQLYDAAMQAALPILGIVGGVFLILAAPFFYRFRMARLHMMANADCGAMAAMRASAQMTRLKRLGLFRLDLSFWWYYALEMAASMLCYGELLFALMGVPLPWSNAVSYFGFLLLSLAAQLLIHWLFKNKVYVTYAKVYLDFTRED